MESVFDHLAREISREERRKLLQKIEQTIDMIEDPLRLDDASAEAPVVLDREFAELPWYSRLKILIVGLFTGRNRFKVTEEFLLSKLRKRVEKAAPGLVDFRRELVSPLLYQELLKLKSAMDVFRRPVTRILDGDRKEFYALLGRIEFEDIQKRLETEALPERVAESKPDSLPAEIKKALDEVFEKILGDIVPDRRRRMRAHATALARLKTLLRFPFEKLFAAYPPGEDGPAAPAGLRGVKGLILELGDALHAFREPPGTTLLETIFLYDAQDKLDADDAALEAELLDRMDRAKAALEIIRSVNAQIPWTPLLKALAEDIRYAPRPVGGGEDWFKLYSQFWRDRIIQKYKDWADRRKLGALLHGLTVLWGLDAIPLVPGYRPTDFPMKAQPRHETSFSAIRAFYLDILPGRLYHAMNLVMIDGKFYKKDNRREYDEVFGRILKTPDKIRAFESRLKPDGSWGSRLAELRREKASGLPREDAIRDLVHQIDREGQSLVVPALQDLAAMGRLLTGILEGNGGPYDTLSNMSDIGGQGHETFRATLREVDVLVDRSSELLSDLVTLEETRTLS